MKTFARAMLFMCAAASAPSTVLAQITITAADVSAQLTLGFTITNNTDTLTTSANIGSPGSNTWDFTGLATHSTATLTSVSVGSTPFVANFPGATHVLQSPVVVVGFPGTGYQYLTLGTSLLNPGNAAFVSLGPLGSGNVTAPNSPLDVTYALPSTLGTTWTSTYTATQVIVLNGTVLSTTATHHDIAYLVDAFGTLKIPGGTVHDALRIRKVENAGTKTVSYIFLAKDGATVQMTASDTLQGNSGLIYVQAKSVSWTPSNPALPIQLASFTASLDGQGTAVHLRWKTLSEVNNYGFEVQKGMSATGEFRSLAGGFVAGHGTTAAPQEYSFVDPGFSGGTWYYRLRQIDHDGASHDTEPLKVESLTAAKEVAPPGAYGLDQNYPNPFNPETTIRYRLSADVHVSLKLYDVLGREVMTLVDQRKSAGEQSVRVNAARLSSGVYTYRLQAGDFVASKKFILCK